MTRGWRTIEDGERERERGGGGCKLKRRNCKEREKGGGEWSSNEDNCLGRRGQNMLAIMTK